MTNARSAIPSGQGTRRVGTPPVTSLLAGVPTHVVSRRLGHRSVQTTLDIYGHVTQDAELAALANWRSIVSSWEVHDG